jgi:hypothetical protein
MIGFLNYRRRIMHPWKLLEVNYCADLRLRLKIHSESTTLVRHEGITIAEIYALK